MAQALLDFRSTIESVREAEANIGIFLDYTIAKRFTARSDAEEAFTQIKHVYEQANSNLTLLRRQLMEGEETIPERNMPSFIEMTGSEESIKAVYDRARSAFAIHYRAPARGGAGAGEATASAGGAAASAHSERPSTKVRVFYEGKGDLFIRGTGAYVQNPASIEALSWDRGIRLHRINDITWETDLVPMEGKVPEYKFLTWDLEFSGGDNYRADAATKVHFPSFKSSSSLLVSHLPPPGHTLMLLGEGTLGTDRSGSFPLGWTIEEGLPLASFSPDTWGLSMEPLTTITFKLVQVDTAGNVTWESGENRTLEKGKEYHLTTDLPRATAAGAGFDAPKAPLFLYDMAKAERWEATAKAVRETPAAAVGDLHSFEPKDVDHLIPFVSMDEISLNGHNFWISKTEKGKSVLMQAQYEGCSAACAAMLIIDNGKEPDGTTLATRGAAYIDDIVSDIEGAGLEAIATPAAGLTLAALRPLIETNGPAIVAISYNPGAVLGHVLVIDEISDDLSKVHAKGPLA